MATKTAFYLYIKIYSTKNVIANINIFIKIRMFVDLADAGYNYLNQRSIPAISVAISNEKK